MFLLVLVNESPFVRAPTLKLDAAISRGEQRVIPAYTHILTGAITSATLAHQDISSQYFLAAELLQAKALGFRVATVSRTAACFFVCHVLLPLSVSHR